MPKCDFALDGNGDERACPRCGAGFVEIRGEVGELIGTVIDNRFEIRAKLGQGGMGTVYRAWQRSVERDVAIKVIERSYSSDAMAVRRFEREARLASKLSQPNTVSVFDFGKTADGRLYIAMELIRGRTLHQVLAAEGGFSIERAVRVGVQICDALEAAHALGIVHRDLKLDNVIVLDDPPGRDLVKVLDFGLAKLVTDVRGTAAGLVVGTPRYMSPEAATSGTAVPAGDVYALGVILAELTTGKPLWEGDNVSELLAHKLDPKRAVASVPLRIRSVIASLIDPSPERRPTESRARSLLLSTLDATSARNVTLDLPQGSPTVSLRAKATKSSRGWPLFALAGGVLAVASIVGVIAYRGGDDRDVPRDARSAAVAPAPSVDAKPISAADVAPDVALDVDATIGSDSSCDTCLERPDDLQGPFVLTVTSKPSGVMVTVGQKSGITPFELLVDGTTPIFVVGRSRGKTQKVSVIPNRDQAVELDFTALDCSGSVKDMKDRACRLQFCTNHPDDTRCSIE